MIDKQKIQDISQEEIDLFVSVLKENTMDEAAKILGISRRSIYNYMNALGIKPFKSSTTKLKGILNKLK
jgi:DNA-binding CsgD family transcriptional regulator